MLRFSRSRDLGLKLESPGCPLFVVCGQTAAQGNCWASYNPAFSGPVRINGDWGDGNVLGAVANATPYIDVRAFMSPASFTNGNTPATGAHGLRNPSFFNQDLSLTRNFHIYESLALVFGVDSFNVFNSVSFGGINTNVTNASLGKVSAQTNLPRVFQFKLRLEF